MRIPSAVRETIAKLIRDLKRHGVDYADVRFERLLHEGLIAKDGRVSSADLYETAGFGIRVLLAGSWGFASTSHLTRAGLNKTVAQAIELAKAAAILNKNPRPLTPIKPVKSRSKSHWDIDPFDVPLSQKLDYLLWSNREMLGPPAVKHATAHMDFFKRLKLFHSTEGSQIEQLSIESGAGLEVVAEQSGEVQTRSAPNSHHGALAQAGFEYVKTLDLVGAAKRAKKEVLQLLRAKSPRTGETTIVLDPTQVVMQLHESCGHPTELDRALGHELSYAGGSFLTPDQLGKLRYGSPQVNIVADATIPGGVGSFTFDDEGVPAQRIELVRKGVFVGYLSSRESAAKINLTSSGAAMRAESWDLPPLIRMTNVNLEPGEATLKELIHDIDHGYLLSTNKSWSIDDRRLNFQFTTEIGWEIRNGSLDAMVKNPLYTGITPEFWGRCTGVGKRENWRLWGVPNCAKGEPIQLMHVGHGASYARFDGVSVSATH